MQTSERLYGQVENCKICTFLKQMESNKIGLYKMENYVTKV